MEPQTYKEENYEENYEEYYDEILREVEAVEVLTQPKEVAALYRRAAKKMEELGDYKDAANLVKVYRAKAEQAKKDGKEYLYAQACDRMNRAESVVERRLAVEMFREVRGYKDADDLRKECERIYLKELRLQDLRKILIWAALILVVALVVYFK